MMNRVRKLLAACLFTTLSVPVMVSAEEMNVDKLLATLEQQMQLSQERYEALKPELKKELEAKSQALSRSLDSALEQGLTELERLGREYEAASQVSSEKLQALLESEEMIELKEYLAGLDREAIARARDELVAEFARGLELSAAQLNALKPLLEEKLQNLGNILKRYLDQGRSDYEQFRVAFEAERQQNAEVIREILDSQQVQKFEAELDSIRESIRRDVFET